jgi:hypothetical protein
MKSLYSITLVTTAMDFESYKKLIMQSIAECGYDDFLPSLCSPSNGAEELNVLQTELHPEGEKAIALEWASQFTAADQKLFCAYRVGNRKIEVVEVTGTEVTNKTHIDVRRLGGTGTCSGGRSPGG